MQNVIPNSMRYSISDSITWQHYKQEIVDNNDLSTTINLVDQNETIESGITTRAGERTQLAIEAVLGVQVKNGSFLSIFTKQLYANIQHLNSILVMQSHTTPFGVSTPILTGSFRVIKQPLKIGQESKLYLYKIN